MKSQSYYGLYDEKFTACKYAVLFVDGEDPLDIAVFGLVELPTDLTISLIAKELYDDKCHYMVMEIKESMQPRLVL